MYGEVCVCMGRWVCVWEGGCVYGKVGVCMGRWVCVWEGVCVYGKVGVCMGRCVCVYGKVCVCMGRWVCVWGGVCVYGKVGVCMGRWVGVWEGATCTNFAVIRLTVAGDPCSCSQQKASIALLCQVRLCIHIRKACS